MSKKVTTALTSAARTTSGASTTPIAVNGPTVTLMMDVTAVSGTTPSMTPELHWSHDGTNWFWGDNPDTMTAVTTAGKRVKSFTAKGPYCRVNYSITGTTPSFTFAAHVYSPSS